ncbi:conserved hypothetical protein [Vibrio coralliirubri]|nr:conserved hypothetical protein [Vibrio coralliirubri]
MTRMEYEINRAIHLYLRTGGKKNRKNQAEKMSSFCRYVQRHNPAIKSIGQIGRKQVAEFWRSKSELAPSTKTAYYYAICYIWNQVLGRRSTPPHYNMVNKR